MNKTTEAKTLKVGMEVTILKVGNIADNVLQFEGLKVKVINTSGPFVYLSDGNETVKVLADSRNDLVWVEYDRKVIAAEKKANLDQKVAAFNKAKDAELESIRALNEFPTDEAYQKSLRKDELVEVLKEVGVKIK